MSSLDFGIITPIDDLVDLFKLLIRGGAFDEVKNILVDRERSLQAELDGIKSHLKVMSDQCRALERKESLDEIERSRLLVKLVRSEDQCGELSANIARLTEEGIVLNERVRVAEERCVKVVNEQSEVLNTKDRMIDELKEKVARLTEEGRVLNEKVRVAQEKCIKVVNEQCEVSNAKNKTIDELNGKVTRLTEEGRMLNERVRVAQEKCIKLVNEQCAVSHTKNKTIDELNGKITRLTEEGRVLSERVKGAEESYSKAVVIELNKKIGDMETHVRGRNEVVEGLTEKLKCAETKLTRMQKEHQVLLSQKSAVDKTIEEMRRGKDRREEELRRRNSEASDTIEELRHRILAAETNKRMSDEALKETRRKSDQTVEELTRKCSEALQTIEELKRQKAEAEELAVVYKNRLGSMVQRIARVGEGLENIMKVDVGDVVSIIKSNAQMEEDMDLYSDQPEIQSQRSVSVPDLGNTNFEVLADTKFGVHSTCSSSRTGCNGLPQRDPIVIIDSNDEIIPVGSASTSDSCANLGKKEKLCDKPPSSCQTFNRSSFCHKRKISSLGNVQMQPQQEKQIRKFAHESDESLNNDFSGKLNLDFGGKAEVTLPSTSIHVIRRCEDKCDDSPKKIPKFVTLLDDSCSKLCPNEILARVPGQDYCRTWMFGNYMLRDFEKDSELCMNAVCALYRQHISTLESDVDSSGRLGHFDAMGGPALAEDLIDGDSELRLRKSVNEVKPEVLHQCRQLAQDYYVKLFGIYCSQEDPFFKPR